MLLALGHQDLTGLFALGLQDGLTALTLGLHLLLHGVLDLTGRQDVLQLHTVDLDAPGVRGLVQNGTHLGVDGITGGKALVQLQLTDDVAQGGGGEVLDGVHGILHAVGIQLGVGDLKVDHGVDLHGDVILGDDWLGIEIRHLLLQAHLLHHTLNEGDLQMQAHAPHGVEGTQPLHHIGTGLLHHIDVADDDGKHQNHQNGDPYDTGDGQIVGRHLFFLLFVL